MNSARVRWSERKTPRTLEVSVWLFCFCTPRIIMQRNSSHRPGERAHIDGKAKKLLVAKPRKERRGHEAPEHDWAERANGVVAPRFENAGRHLHHAIR